MKLPSIILNTIEILKPGARELPQRRLELGPLLGGVSHWATPVVLRRRLTARNRTTSIHTLCKRTPRAAPKMGAEEKSHSQPAQKQGPETANQTLPDRITQADFLSWKRRKDAKASARKADIERKRAEDIAAGLVSMNGRELFQNEPHVFDNSRF